MALNKNLAGWIATSSLILLTGCATTVKQKTSRMDFESTVEQMSKDLLRPGEGENWKPDSGLAREVQRHKPELAALVEDANWVVALTVALNGTLPGDVKKSLRQLHKYYAEGAPNEDIAREVGELLPKIPDEKLRKELKKLANRSWDRDRRKTTGPGQSPVRAVREPPQQQPLVRATPLPPLGAKGDAPPSAIQSADTSIEQSKNQVDTLMSHGHYLEALRKLEMVEDKAGVDWVKMHRVNLGNRYCEERRSMAANAFVASRKARKDSLKDQYLRQSLAELDSCLFQFPDAPVTEKVRRNRALVEKELRR